MPVAVHAPFPGPVPLRQQNPVGLTTILGSLALAAVGVGFGLAGVRERRQHGRLRCAHEYDTPQSPHVGVPLSYEGDWWAERGKRLYWQARRAGETTASGIAKTIIAADVGEGSFCLGQFPPNENTIDANRSLWNNLVAKVQQEMANERAA